MHYELIDDQIRISGANADRYFHRVRAVDESSGLKQAAQIEADFDPHYQSLMIHQIRIVRGGRTIDKLSPSNVKLLQRESQLESQIYNGKVTASILLSDVRVGDHIEYAYTVSGSNPVFNGKYSDTIFAAATLGPVALYQVRLVAPEGRDIHFRAAPNVKVTSQIHDGQREMIFRRSAIPQVQYDGTIPTSAYIPDLIQLSEFSDWNDVARWGEQQYDPPVAASGQIKAEADKIRMASSTPQEKLLAALDFVQKQVRYFGTEVGPYSYRPAAPAKVMEQRYGDCKDKVALLIALLRELGLAADPVLVSVNYLDDVAARLPSPDMFDHVIARVKLDNEVFWLDGTRNFQTGPITQRQALGFGRGLILRSSEHDLSPLPSASGERRTDIAETFTIGNFSDDPLLDERITFYEEFAEGTRNRIASQPLEQLETEFTSGLARYYPGLTRNASTTIEESKADNAITVVMHFKVSDFWKYPQQNRLTGQVAFWSPLEAIRFASDPGRKYPYRIQSPGLYHQTITVNFPEDIAQAPDVSQFDDSSPFYKYHVGYRLSQRQFAFEARLQLFRNKVELADWPTYTDKVVKLSQRFAAYPTVSPITLSQNDQLTKEAKQLERAIDARDVKAVTSVQRYARFRVLAMTSQLNGGRLKPKFRASALLDRGTQYDHLGMLEEARNDFEEAIRLAPDNADAYESAALNASARGDEAKAIEYASKHLELVPSASNAHVIKARSYYKLGNFQLAKQELLSALESSSEVETSYAAIWLYFTARHLSEDAVATTKPYMPTGAAPQWPYKVLQYLTGNGDLNSAITQAKEDAKNPSRLCELYYFLGENAVLDGDITKARGYFNQAIDTRVTEFIEYGMAKYSLQRLNVSRMTDRR